MKKRNHKLKIITFNTTERKIDALIKLIQDDGLYPSKSEIIRIATKWHLQKLRTTNVSPKTIKPNIEIHDKSIIKIPYTEKDENGNIVKKFKIHKVIREA